MTAQVIDLSGAKQQLQEHKTLREKIADMTELLELRPSELTEDPAHQSTMRHWQGEMAGQLKHMQTHLRQHFQTEESSPMFEDGEPYFLRFSDEIEVLLKEHDTMLKNIRSFIERISAHHDPALPKEIRMFLNMLIHHEHEENRILQAAYGDDLGEGD